MLEEAKELIRGLLTVNPEERLTVEEVQEHAWLRHKNSPQTPLATPTILGAASGLHLLPHPLLPPLSHGARQCVQLGIVVWNFTAIECSVGNRLGSSLISLLPFLLPCHIHIPTLGR